MGVLTKRRSKKKMSLQLTSLLDMFTIILVFLMVSFQAEDKDFVLNSGLQLPQSNAKNPFKTAVNLAITKEAVFVQNTISGAEGAATTASCTGRKKDNTTIPISLCGT